MYNRFNPKIAKPYKSEGNMLTEANFSPTTSHRIKHAFVSSEHVQRLNS
jgi:hypothetical protein